MHQERERRIQAECWWACGWRMRSGPRRGVVSQVKELRHYFKVTEAVKGSFLGFYGTLSRTVSAHRRHSVKGASAVTSVPTATMTITSILLSLFGKVQPKFYF